MTLKEQVFAILDGWRGKIAFCVLERTFPDVQSFRLRKWQKEWLKLSPYAPNISSEERVSRFKQKWDKL